MPEFLNAVGLYLGPAQRPDHAFVLNMETPGTPRPSLRLLGSYTLEPLAEVARHWLDALELGVDVALEPYGQVYQSILDPRSAWRDAIHGARILVVRWADLATDNGGAQAAAEELGAALAGMAHDLPCLVITGPGSGGDEAAQQADRWLAGRLDGLPNVWVLSGDVLMERYSVSSAHDETSNRFGHVPFTPQAFAALGTGVARWYSSLVRRPVKVLAVDGDNTLWSGVVGEDGIDGVRVDAAHRELQAALLAQARQGRLLCLVSKNEEADLRELFMRRRDLVLSWDDFVAHRVNWAPKPDNLRELAAELDLGLDGFVFLDDNPAECASMRAQCPQVTTICVPTDPLALHRLPAHLWPFDLPRVTDEDRRRATMYRENASRAALRQQAPSFAEFYAKLDLHVSVEPVDETSLERAAQLTQRTNQFNASLLRCDEAAVRAGLDKDWHRLLRVRDRFGDYGLVGQVRGRVVDNVLRADLFMLSCRVLGRGVEHRMVAALGEEACRLGVGRVEILYLEGPRNAVMRRFLESAMEPASVGAQRWFGLSSTAAAALAFDPSESAGTEPEQGDDPVEAKDPPSAFDPALYEGIATRWSNAEAIVGRMAERTRRRPDLAAAFVEPAAGLQSQIAQIWQEVLRVDRVGARDRFQDLGGRSIHLVRIHRLLLDRCGLDVNITTLFQFASVAELADSLGRPGPSSAVDEGAKLRSQRMREARARAASRAMQGV